MTRADDGRPGGAHPKPSADAASTPKRFIRADMQALRALAVVLVILDHIALLQRLPGSPEGGFIGVDVFFVISGFLITGHLVREAARDGRVDFRGFYVRRARRILPMAVLVAVISVIASFVVFWPARAYDSFIDGIWSLLFVSNIAFAVSGTDYFSGGTTSIFQHYWSLSVEEQFYLLWPVVVVVVASLALRWRWSVRRGLMTAALVLGVASFAWAFIDTATNPAAAYFSTLGRGFEFLLGAGVAIAAPLIARWNWSIAFRRSLSIIGFVGILLSVWIIHPGGSFPGPAAILPALCAALFIAAGTGTERNVAIWPLTTRPVRYVGDISYSLYLWHWPIIVILAALIPMNSVVFIATALGLTLVLSAVSYRCVERAVLSSSWLMGRRSSEPRLTKSASALRPIGVMSAALVVTIVVIAGVVTVETSRSRVVEAQGVTALAIDAPAVAVAEVRAIQDRLGTASQSASWEGTSPRIDDLGEGVSGVLRDECWNGRGEPFRTCTLGDQEAPHSIAVLGDSIAMNKVPALQRAIESNPDWNVHVYTKAGCPAAEVTVFDTDGSVYEECDEFRAWAVESLLAEEPDSVLIVSALIDELPGDEGTVGDRVQGGLASTLASLETVPDVVVMSPVPLGRALGDRANRFSTPSDCSTTISSGWLRDRDRSFDTVTELGRTYVDTSLWYCTPDGRCPSVIGDLVVRRDPRHLTREYSESLAQLVGAWTIEHTASPDS